MFDKLLVPVDGSLASLVAVSLAGRLSPQSVTLLHARRSGPLMAAAGLDAAIAAVTGASNAARERVSNAESEQAAELLAAARASLPETLPVETLSPEGRASDAILETLEGGTFDAVVLGSRGRGLIARSLLGSVSDQVLRGARTSVLIARRDALQRLVVAVDGSASALNAARTAGELAKRTQATVLLVACVELTIQNEGEERQQMEAALRLRGQQVLDEARQAMGLVAVEQQLIIQEPAHALLEAVERSGADLVVLGRRGTHPSRFSTLGSVAHSVATHTSASVLVVP